MAPVREVAFELECFEWAEERLEVAGRWKGLGPRRLNRPVLTVETETGRRKRIVALPGGHFGGAGEPWRASFSWPGDPGEITAAALEVGGSLVVDLPLPDRKRRRRRRPATDAADESLRAEVAALRGQVERLRAELAGREREIIALRAQLDEETGEDPAAERAGADERTVEINRLAGELERRAEEVDQRTVELRQLALERDEARAELSAGEERRRAEQTHLQEEVDALREAFADAAAEAEAARDRHRAELAALQDELRAERAEVARLSSQLTKRGQKPGARAAAAGPPTEAMPAPDGGAGPPTEAMPGPEGAAGPPTEAMPAPAAAHADRAGGAAGTAAEGTGAAGGAGDDDASSSGGDAMVVEAAALDAPGPMRAGARPAAPPGAEEQPDVSRMPAWLQRGGADTGEGPLHALKERFAGRFASNGHAAEDEESDAAGIDQAVPRPLRSAAAARARAGATVAARRSAAEIWAVRVLAALLVAVLLVAFVLILTSVA